MPHTRAPWLRFALFCLILALACPGSLLAASYDCAKAGAPREKAVCADPQLSKLDEQLGQVYKQVMRQTQDPEKTALKTSQFAWLRELDACMSKPGSKECLRVAYETRLDFLGGASAGPATPPKTAPAPSEQAGAAWLLAFAGKSTNTVVWDPRFKKTLAEATPAYIQDLGMGQPAALSATVREFIGGPPDEERVEAKRYVTLSACRAHSCPEKAWLWFDLEEKASVGALAHYIFGKETTDEQPDLLLFSMRYEPGQLPEKALASLRAWLRENNLQVRKTRFVNAKAQAQELPGVP